MANELLLSKLSQNLLEILDDEEYYDVTIEVGNDPYVKVFRAHMVILNYRSPYLRRILSTNKRKNDGTLTHIKLPSILPEIFQIILRYIYGGELTLEEYDTSYVVKILVAASELSLQELIPHLQSFLIKNKTKWIEQNFNSIYQTSFENDSFLDLQKFCTELISKQPDKIFNSPDFTSISEKVLISLIQLDKVQMSEVQIWEHVLKWVKNSDEILGGYNPIMWESRDYDFSDYDYSKTKDSFIFSFNNKVDIKNHILSRVENENYAIDNSISLGPSFGISDLVICGDFFHDYGNYCKRSSYEKQIRETGDKFAIEEYEIFQIIVT
ncbi:BTB/POZ protein [Rhizophagus irregularis DAOM 181602=DAOM 197198]|nr:BTB/POZ protein [Rhizophagus irregularis DAOM 181602=DAOM 197198]